MLRDTSYIVLNYSNVRNGQRFQTISPIFQRYFVFIFNLMKAVLHIYSNSYIMSDTNSYDINTCSG